MKNILNYLLISVVFVASGLNAQPTDNPVASQYNDGYPAWTDQIAWDNVLDVTTDARLAGQVIVADAPASAADNFAAFEAARDVLYTDGGGVLSFPAGTYYFEQPDAGYGPGIGPNSRGLMLKKGIVIRGDALVGSNAIIRDPAEQLDVTYDLESSTIFVFPFQKRGTVPANATGVDGEPAGTANAAGETPTDWNFIGITPGTNETGVSDVDNVGIVNVTLQGGTVVFGFDSEWAAFMGDTGVKWEGNKFKVDWPAGSAAESEDWINRVPNGEHYGDLINGRSGWTKEVVSGSGRLVMNTKIIDGAPWMDFIYADRNDSSSTNLTADAFSHYRFAGRVIAYGSNVFIANNVLAKPTRNFVHDQLQDTGIQTILFDYANHLGIDVNKSLLGGNQGHPSVHVIDGEGYYASNIVIKDNWVFNRGNKGFEVAGRHAVIQGNHNQRYVAANSFPYEHITNPEAYPSAVAGGDINAGGISFDGYRWQSTESASDYLSRGYDLGGMDVWVDDCTVINTGSRGNDGEAILGQRHNNIETCSWSVTNSKFGPYTIDDSPSSSSGANSGYIGPYDMHSMGLFLMHNSGAGSVGMFKPESNYMLDGTWADNAASQATPATGHSDDWIAPGKAVEPHTDAVNAPALSAAVNADGTGVDLSWVDNATNELGFRVERRINGGDWSIISYRPRASEDGVAAYPDATIASAVGQFDVGDIVQTQWTDYLAPLEESLEYRVVAINANDDDSTGISNVEVLSSPFMSGSLDVEGLVAGAIDGQEGWAYTADGASRLPGDGVAVTAGGLDWTAADGGMIAAGTQHLYTQAGLGTNGKMDRWLSYSPVSISGPSYIRFVAMMETRPGDSTIGATDPYELFFGLTNNASISGAPWNAYVALKHSADGSAVGVETTNSGGLLANAGVALDTPMLVVAKYETDVDGALVGMKVWINPDEADEGSPDHTITFDSSGVVLADQDHLKFRMQNMPTRIDHLMVAGSWAEVVPEAAPPFMSGSLDVEGLVAGAIDGQEGWAYTADGASRLPGDGVAVTAGGLDWTAADGGMIAAGTQHLYTQAGLGTNGKMDRWLSYSPVSISGPSYIRFVAMMETRPGDSTIGATDPYELFFGLTNNASISGAPWNAYVALKHSADGSAVGVETTNSGGLLANAGVALDTPMLVVAKYETDVDGALVGMKVWINPDEADEGSPDHTITFDSPGVVLADQDHLKFRMQNMPTRIDHLMVAGSWAEVVPEAAVLPYPGLFLPFDDLNVGLLSGQDGWTINSADISKAIVAGNVGLTYTAADGTTVKGGTTGLVLSGSPLAKMNNFATRPLDPTPTGTTYFRILLNGGNKGTAADPGELFVRLAGWNLYVAAKYYAGVIELPGGNSLEVDTTNGLPLDQTHMIIMGMNAEGGVVTSLDLWLNPVADDSGNPDLTVDGLDLDISAVSQLELRSQNTQIFVDEIALAETWEEVAPESSTPFESLASSFDDLNIGTINGQGDWAIDAADEDKATVAGGSLTYIAPDGAELTGGAQHLVLSGSPDPKMNNWLTLPVVPGLDETTYFRALVSTSDAGVAGSPAELFIRLAGWSLYIGTKFTEGVVELPGPNVIEVDTVNGLPLDVTHMLLLRMNVSAGEVTSLDFWLNPSFADESSPDLTLNPFSLNVSSISQIELRSQNTTTLVDEVLLAESWAEVVPEATTPVAPTILAGPASLSVLVGEPVQLSVSAAGTPTLTYQWRKDGVAIDGATESSFTIPSAALTDSGSYDVVITNAQGSATSDPAVVEVTEEVIVPIVTLFEETFDSGETEETAAPVALADLGWNVHHSFAGINLDGLLVDPENADETSRNLEMVTSTSIGDFNIGEPYGYMSFFVNNYPAYGQGSEGDRPILPGPHPDTGVYYHNRTLATFLWKEAGISEVDRSTITEFNFVQGNRDGSQHNFFPAVQIDGQWYVYIVDQQTLGTDVRILGRPGQSDPNGAETVFSGSQFSEGGAYANYYNAQPYSFAWSETGWTELVFDGGAGTNSTVGMTIGDPVAGELPMSAITAVGVYSPENIDPGYNFNGLRIDSIQILGEAQQEDLFTFTFNNEGTVNGSDRPIQAAEWDGLYSTTAQPLVTNEAVIADLSEGVSDDTTPGSYKAGFLFVSGKDGQPAPEGFLVYSTNTNVVDVPQLPQGGAETVNPQTDWYSDPTNSVSDLNQLLAKDLGELQMRINPRNTSIRYHFALQIGGEWYVSEQAFQHTGSGSWESVSLNAGSANWLSGVVGVDSINFDFTAVAPSVVKLADLASDVTLDTVGIYIDTDDGVGQTDTWARVDSITLSSVVPALQGPTITEQPASLAVTTGGTADFSVGVEAVGDVTYQWRKDEVDLDGETAATLSLAGVVEADEGDYDVVVTNAVGSVTSQAATLTVYALPTLDQNVFDVDSTAQSLQVILTAEATEVTWTVAEAQDDWITITYAGSGLGSDLILFGALENPDYVARSGTLTVAGQTVTINQDGKPLPASFEEAVGAVDNGDGSFTSAWFGTFTSPGMDWIVHEEAGLLHVGAVVVPTDMVMFSFPVNGWVWTSEAAFPIMYEFTTGEWIYYVVVDQSVYVYSYDLDSWSY